MLSVVFNTHNIIRDFFPYPLNLYLLDSKAKMNTTFVILTKTKNQECFNFLAKANDIF